MLDLLGHMLFQALVSCLLPKGKSLAGPPQEEGFGGGLLPDCPCKQIDLCSLKAADAS